MVFADTITFYFKMQDVIAQGHVLVAIVANGRYDESQKFTSFKLLAIMYIVNIVCCYVVTSTQTNSYSLVT